MKLSQDITTIFSSETNEQSTFGDSLKRINHKSFGVFLAVLALPSALPIPAPGYSTPFGILLVALGVQIAINRQYLWFPKFVKDKPLPSAKESKMLQGMIRFLEFFEQFLKPRIKVLSKGVFYRFVGVLVMFCGLSMILPIPLTNTIPAFGTFLLGLGLMEEDGVAILLGALTAVLGIGFTSLIIYLFTRFGLEGVNTFKDWIKSLI
ncbi:MAG: exopolysaccharide biosynthesis protein [Patescibacteria group bacterium]